MTKQDKWNAILELAKKEPIINSYFRMYDEGQLEDQCDILMHIVLEQHEKIKALELTQSNLISDKYSKKQSMREKQ